MAVVICAGALGWRTDAVQDKLRALDRVVSAHYVGEADAETVADYAATGYVAGLGDQWSSYIPADQYEQFRMNSEGQGCGIGVSVVSTADSIRVNLVYDGSPRPAGGRPEGRLYRGARPG